MKFLRMRPGHGEVLLTEGDPDRRGPRDLLPPGIRRLIAESRLAAHGPRAVTRRTRTRGALDRGPDLYRARAAREERQEHAPAHAGGPWSRPPRRAPRARAAPLVCERRGVVDVPRPRLHPRARLDAGLRVPHLPAQAGRGVHAGDRPAAERVLRRVP